MYTLEATAALESRIAYALDTVGYSYTRQATAVIESRIAYARDTVRDNKLCYKLTVKIEIFGII